jgi:TPR repeat protein
VTIAAQSAYGFCLATGRGVSTILNEPVRYLRLAADQGDAAAQFIYGYCLVTGEGVSKI